jgi:signal transduction histidine kinase
MVSTPATAHPPGSETVTNSTRGISTPPSHLATSESSSDDPEVVRRVQELHHDIRQPLAAIGALASAGMAQPDVPDVVVTCLERIRSETRMLLELCRHILEEMQAEQPVALDVAAREIAACAARSAQCAVEVEATPCTISTNPMDFRRALVNLLDNAVRAAGPDGAVSVIVQSDPRQVRLSVRDSGPGFGAIDGGCGIGLGVVERYARRHGGMVEVGQSPSGGASVSIVLPSELRRTTAARQHERELATAETA